MRIGFFVFIGATLFFSGFFTGKFYYDEEKNRIRFFEPAVKEIKFFKNRVNLKQDDHVNKEIIELPSFVIDDLRHYGIDVKNLTKDVWEIFLFQLKKNNFDELLAGDDKKETLMHLAVRSGSLSMVDKLLNIGYDINTKNKYGNTPLLIAFNEHSNLKFIKELVERGADISINYDSEKKDDVLSNALSSGKYNDQLISYLKEQGFEFKKKHFKQLSYDYNKEYLYEHLQNVGENPQLFEGRSYFEQLLKENTDNDVIDYMLKNNLDLRNDSQGYNALHAATMNKKISIENLQKIIDMGIDIDLSNGKSYQTPLMYAVFNGDIKKIKLYLENGADVSRVDWLGKTVYDFLNQSIMYQNNEDKEKVKKLLDRYK